MSERLYFMFGLPTFEIELKNTKLMVNHEAVKFNGENYSFHLEMIGLFMLVRDTERVELHGEILPISARCRKSRRELDRDLRNPQTLWRDLSNLGEMEEISPRTRRDSETHKHHGEISVISARWRISRRDLAEI